MIHVGDCLEVMRGMADNSVDAIVTDPPYGLSFMGKHWDCDVPSTDIWAQCLRVLKPGGHLLAFAGTRTQHRMAVRIEDAGFEIRDMIAWVYGSGFPKSHNGEWGGTALKPALEPITVARKPLVGTVEANWRQHGTGALNIDSCRVGVEATRRPMGKLTSKGIPGGGFGSAERLGNRELVGDGGSDCGRWPANLIHDGSDEVLAAFPDAKGNQGPISSTSPSEKTSGIYGRMRRVGEASADSANAGAVGFKLRPGERRLDEGSAARFFYCAKASREDRNDGLESGARPAVAANATMRERDMADWPARNGNHQPPVRWEYRHKTDSGPGCWVAATSEHVYHAAKRGWIVRALWETPRVIQPERDHDFKAGVCTKCGDSLDWAGPDCLPMLKPVDPRTRLPIDPRWLVEPLKWLRDAGPLLLNRYDREKRAKEAAFLLEKIEAHILECQKP